MLQEIFKNSKINFNKLEKYGFIEFENNFIYKTSLLDGQFEMIVAVDRDGRISTKVIDCALGEEYVLHLMKDAVGEFVGKIKCQYSERLLDIREKCCEKHIFKSRQAKEIIIYVREKYGDELEHLWETTPSNAIWRRKDNQKWYGALLTIKKCKLGFDCENEVEIIDLRISPQELESLIDNQKYFAGYHMNKKHWLTIILDGSISTKEICDRIDQSYLLAKK